jgi:hypothetical protein
MARSGCAELLAKSAALKSQRDVAEKAAEAEYRKQHPQANPAEHVADDMELMLFTLQNVHVPTLTDDESAKVKTCERGPDFAGALVLAFVTAAIWSLAFVFGGRFWLPPRASV